MRRGRMSYQARPGQRFSLGTNLCFGGLLLLMFLVLGGAFGNLHRPADHPTALVPQSPADISSFIDRTSILSDFDGDGQPDLMASRPEGSHYKIDVQLSAQHQNVSFIVFSRESRIGLIAWDADGDQDADLRFAAVNLRRSSEKEPFRCVEMQCIASLHAR